MPWVKLDDGFYDHPKMRAAGKDGRALLQAALCHSSAQLTDGLIADADLGLVAAKAEVRGRPTAKQLVAVDVFHRAGHACERCPPCPVGAHLIHEYHVYQPSAEQERKRRREVSEVKSRAGRMGAAARWGPAGFAGPNSDFGARALATDPDSTSAQVEQDESPVSAGQALVGDGTPDGTPGGTAMANGMAQPWHGDGPDPDPSGVLSTTAAAGTPGQRQQRINEACLVLAQERAERRDDIGPGWIKGCARGLAVDHHQALHGHLVEQPEASVSDLIDLIEGAQPAHRPPAHTEPTIAGPAHPIDERHVDFDHHPPARIPDTVATEGRQRAAAMRQELHPTLGDNGHVPEPFDEPIASTPDPTPDPDPAPW